MSRPAFEEKIGKEREREKEKYIVQGHWSEIMSKLPHLPPHHMYTALPPFTTPPPTTLQHTKLSNPRGDESKSCRSCRTMVGDIVGELVGSAVGSHVG